MRISAIAHKLNLEALRYFEDIIKEMAEVRDISTETVWISVDGLKRADIINSKLYEDATLVRKDPECIHSHSRSEG